MKIDTFNKERCNTRQAWYDCD